MTNSGINCTSAFIFFVVVDMLDPVVLWIPAWWKKVAFCTPHWYKDWFLLRRTKVSTVPSFQWFLIFSVWGLILTCHAVTVYHKFLKLCLCVSREHLKILLMDIRETKIFLRSSFVYFHKYSTFVDIMWFWKFFYDFVRLKNENNNKRWQKKWFIYHSATDAACDLRVFHQWK